ncbi:MAG TPA: hypothetical protein VHA56_02655 [Mucilaginibacter sp.]|nr:hypothetical protein [Mucilaginibacter sp.]
MISGLIGITIRKLGHALTLVFCLLGIIVFAAPFSEEPPGDDEKNSSSGSDGDDDYEDHYGSESDNPPGDPEAFKV